MMISISLKAVSIGITYMLISIFSAEQAEHAGELALLRGADEHKLGLGQDWHMLLICILLDKHM